MVCTEMTMLYEKYKTEWMLEHGITMSEFIRVLDNYRIEQEQVLAEFILYGDLAVNQSDATEKVRSVIITWLWLNDEKGNAY